MGVSHEDRLFAAHTSILKEAIRADTHYRTVPPMGNHANLKDIGSSKGGFINKKNCKIACLYFTVFINLLKSYFQLTIGERYR